MIKPSALVVPLYDVEEDDTPEVGYDAARLGELIASGFPIIPGFVVTASAHSVFINHSKLDQKIRHLLGTTDFREESSVAQVAKHIKKLVAYSEIPQEVVDSIFAEYEKLGPESNVSVSLCVMSGNSKEISSKTSNFIVTGEASLSEVIKEAWSGLFDSSTIISAHEKGIDLLAAKLSLLVQKNVQSKVKGTVLSHVLQTGEKNAVVIQLPGERYEVDKSSLVVTNIQVSGGRQLQDAEIIALSNLSIKAQKHFYFPQNLEWVKEADRIYITRVAPVTLNNDQKSNPVLSPELSSLPILIGIPVGTGIGVGTVKKVYSLSDLAALKPGDILVVRSTDRNFVHSIKMVSGLITEEGGITSHAAIIASEFGIPAVVDVRGALGRLTNGQQVTVNGKVGEVYKGGFLTRRMNSEQVLLHKNATKILINTTDPAIARSAARLPVDGVGIFRGNHIIEKIGVHPKKLIAEKKGQVIIERIADSLGAVCDVFYPRPVFYSPICLNTDEYRKLAGGELYEPNEPNPALGYHGALRLLHDVNTLKIELAAIKYVREKLKLNNLNFSIPFVRSVTELSAIKKVLQGEGLSRSPVFKLYFMAEVPSSVILVDQFISEGVDGISLNPQILSSSFYAIDRQNKDLESVVQQRNDSIFWAIKRVTEECHRANISSSLCFETPSALSSFIEVAVQNGIDSISVSLDALDIAQRVVRAAEEKIVTKYND
jgi:pyruvate,water dikinase